MLLVFICLIAFSNALVVIDTNQQYLFESQGEEYVTLIPQKFNLKWFDATLTQYLLGLGEFEMIGAIDESQSPSATYLVYSYFFAATIITQIILFNTLIAILGDTYARIIEKRDMYAIIQRT